MEFASIVSMHKSKILPTESTRAIQIFGQAAFTDEQSFFVRFRRTLCEPQRLAAGAGHEGALAGDFCRAY